MAQRILIVDDDTAHRGMLKTILGSWKYETVEAADGEEACQLVQKEPFDLVLSDVRMERMDGMTALASIVQYNPALPVILMTAYSSVETAVAALRKGAFDYLIKPLDFDLLRETIAKALAQSQIGLEQKGLRRQLCASVDQEILGQSESIRALLETIATVAPTEATVLVTGESGTGKELVARALHRQSKRATKPFVVLNCAALSETLLESELFGHEKGAFTGADRRREGRFVQADGGTLFLDEIGEMPLQLQAKLLRVLQQGEIQRVGSDVSSTVNVRVLAATNRTLSDEVAKGTFRQDLYFRLNVITVEVPPLRSRGIDIPLLAAHFLKVYAQRNKKTVKGFSPKAMHCMVQYSWPGNVRELENALERAVILAKGDYIQETDLPQVLWQGTAKAVDGPDWSCLTLEGVEKLAITQMLKATGDNKSETARRLGITRATLHSKLKRYALEE